MKNERVIMTEGGGGNMDKVNKEGPSIKIPENKSGSLGEPIEQKRGKGWSELISPEVLAATDFELFDSDRKDRLSQSEYEIKWLDGKKEKKTAEDVVRDLNRGFREAKAKEKSEDLLRTLSMTDDVIEVQTEKGKEFREFLFDRLGQGDKPKGESLYSELSNKARQEDQARGIVLANIIATNYGSLSEKLRGDLEKFKITDGDGKEVSAADVIARLSKGLAAGGADGEALGGAKLANKFLEELGKSNEGKVLYDKLIRDSSLGDADKREGEDFVKTLGGQVTSAGEGDGKEVALIPGMTDKKVIELAQDLRDPKKAAELDKGWLDRKISELKKNKWAVRGATWGLFAIILYFSLLGAYAQMIENIGQRSGTARGT